MQLPIEMILEIIQYASPLEQVLFSQACRPLRIVLRKYGTIHAANLELRDRIKLLYTLARDRRDAWACDRCCRLHPVCHSDYPGRNPCISHQAICYGGTHHDGLRVRPALASGFSRSYENHILQTLKLARMHTSCSRRQLRYLKCLLEPFPTFRRGNDNVGYPGLCEPKLVQIDGALHYLVRCTLRLEKGQCFSQPPLHTSPLDLCEHQLLQRRWQGPSVVTRVAPRSRLWQGAESQEYLSDPASVAIVSSGGGCRRCLTDITITPEDEAGDAVTLRVWQCFGTETEPSSFIWRIRAHLGLPQEAAAIDWGPLVGWGSDRVIPRKAGWVREMYEDQEAFRTTGSLAQIYKPFLCLPL